MGINYKTGCLQLFQEVCKKEQIVLSGLRMAELGNQRFRASTLGKEIAAKKVFEAMGVLHESFDLNGRDGAIKLDLSQPLPLQYKGKYNLVTNFGMSEHVKQSQYWCWRNIHEMCGVDGFILHLLPEVGSWAGHSKYHYTLSRVLSLGAECNYRVCTKLHRFKMQKGKRTFHCLTLCFQHKGSKFPDEKTFNGIMFPEGED